MVCICSNLNRLAALFLAVRTLDQIKSRCSSHFWRAIALEVNQCPPTSIQSGPLLSTSCQCSHHYPHYLLSSTPRLLLSSTSWHPVWFILSVITLHLSQCCQYPLCTIQYCLLTLSHNLSTTACQWPHPYLFICCVDQAFVINWRCCLIKPLNQMMSNMLTQCKKHWWNMTFVERKSMITHLLSLSNQTGGDLEDHNVVDVLIKKVREDILDGDNPSGDPGWIPASLQHQIAQQAKNTSGECYNLSSWMDQLIKSIEQPKTYASMMALPTSVDTRLCTFTFAYMHISCFLDLRHSHLAFTVPYSSNEGML